MDHEPVRRGAVPVLLVGLEVDAVAGADHLRRRRRGGRQADPVGDVQGLAQRVAVPGGPGAGDEADVGAADGGLVVGVADAVDVDVAGEPVRGPVAVSVAAAGELHGCSFRAVVDASFGARGVAADRVRRSSVGWRVGQCLRAALELVGQRARLARQQLGAGLVARVDRMPVVDLQRDVPLAQRDVLGLERQPALLLGEQLDLLAGGGGPEPPVGDVPPHVAHGHPGGGEARDPHELVEVVLVVDAVLAARATADRRDHPDGLVVAQRAGRQPGQRRRLLDRVLVLGGSCAHTNDA